MPDTLLKSNIKYQKSKTQTKNIKMLSLLCLRPKVLQPGNLIIFDF